MTVVHHPIPIRNVSVSQAIVELKQKMTEYEHAYDCTSEDMAKALESGKRTDTSDIVEWMMLYRQWLRLTSENK